MPTPVPQGRKLTDLDVDQRAEAAYDLFLKWAKGKSIAALSRESGFNRGAVKTLIDEHAAVERVMNGDSTKQQSIASYDFVIEKMVEVIEDAENQPVLVRAQAPQTLIQAVTRKDKLLGHESPTMNVNVNARTTIEKIRAIQAAEGSASPADLGVMGEEDIEDAEWWEDQGDDIEDNEGEDVDDDDVGSGE